MDWCFSCTEKGTDTNNEIETDKAESISKKPNSASSSMIRNQRTNSNTNHNQSNSMFTFSKQTSKDNKVVDSKEGNVIFVDSISQVSSIAFDLSMCSSSSKMSSLGFCYDDEDNTKYKLKPPKTKVIYKTK